MLFRSVKDAFRKLENPCTCPREFPVCICGKKPMGRVVTRKAVIADAQEQRSNPRSRSAKLRCFERLILEENVEEVDRLD